MGHSLVLLARCHQGWGGHTAIRGGAGTRGSCVCDVCGHRTVNATSPKSGEPRIPQDSLLGST